MSISSKKAFLIWLLITLRGQIPWFFRCNNSERGFGCLELWFNTIEWNGDKPVVLIKSPPPAVNRRVNRPINAQHCVTNHPSLVSSPSSSKTSSSSSFFKSSSCDKSEASWVSTGHVLNTCGNKLLLLLLLHQRHHYHLRHVSSQKTGSAQFLA